MFTGIIEAIGTITEVISTGSNKTFWIASSISDKLKIDQSLAHNGACLTIEEIRENTHRVTAIEETLHKTNLHTWQPGTILNLERSLTLSTPLDGHIVQGHVDAVATCMQVTEKSGSHEYMFSFDKAFAHLVIEKGSIAINGTSLTVFNVTDTHFTVAIIPYTFEHTSIRQLRMGDIANIEFDVIGKYVSRLAQLK